MAAVLLQGLATARAGWDRSPSGVDVPALRAQPPARPVSAAATWGRPSVAVPLTGARPQALGLPSRPFQYARRAAPLQALSPVPSGDSGADAAAPSPPSPDASSSGSDSDASTEARIDLNLPRRSRLVSFTCNVCGGRTERLVNPIAWERGMVIVQCGECQAWHKIADAANLVEEIRYADLENEALNSDQE